jgi:hypothetical protein
MDGVVEKFKRCSRRDPPLAGFGQTDRVGRGM